MVVVDESMAAVIKMVAVLVAAVVVVVEIVTMVLVEEPEPTPTTPVVTQAAKVAVRRQVEKKITCLSAYGKHTECRTLAISCLTVTNVQPK